jgi:hypothetical protein
MHNAIIFLGDSNVGEGRARKTADDADRVIEAIRSYAGVKKIFR